MRKVLLAAIMAASALIPAAAMAQDNPDRPRGEEGRGQQRAPTPGAEGRTQWQRPEGQRPQGQRPQGQPVAPAQARPGGPPQVQQAPAQQRPDRGGRPDGQGGRPDFRDGRGNFGGQPQAQGVPPQQMRGAFDNRQNGRPDFNGGQRGGDPRGDGRFNQQNGGRPDFRGNDGRGSDNRGYNGGYNNNSNRGGWSRDWRRDNRYNYNSYRNQNRGAYHLPRYYAPYGWNGGYRRFSIGFGLSSVLFSQNYWISEPDYYRLPPAYGPYRWVRYYNDALLVDIRTGYVVDTVYDIFW